MLQILARMRTERAEATARAELAARSKRHADDVVARWKAMIHSVDSFDPTEDAGDFAAWEDFERYSGHPWSRPTEAGHYHERVAWGLGQSEAAPNDWTIIRAAFPREEWARPAARRWVLLEDTRTPARIDLPSREREPERWAREARSFADAYRARLPEPMRDLGIVLGLTGGKTVHAAVWLGESRTPAEIYAWLRAFDGGESPRFKVLDATGCPHWVACAPARAAVAPAIDDLREPAPVTGAVVPTGIHELDGLIRLGGTEPGGLVVFVAQEKNGKTLSMLQVAEHRTSLGRQGVWVARDESAASIQKRRWQYRGESEADAKARVARGEVVKDSLTVAVAPLDRVLEVVAGVVAGGQPVDLYLDSLNGDATGQHEIDTLVRRLKATGADLFVTAEGTAGRSGSTRVKGSTGVAFAADLTVALRYKKADGGETLTMRVARSRIANDGEVTVAVNTAGQRFVAAGTGSGNTTAPPPLTLTKAEARREEQISAALAKGPKTAGALRQWVNGNGATLAAALERMISTGKVTLNGDEYALC